MRAEIIQRLAVGRKAPSLAQLDVENQDIQLPLRHHAGVLLPKAARGGVARIGEERLTALLPGSVQLLENLLGHKNLTPDNQPRRCVLNPQRNAADGAQIFGHVLAGLAVAAGCAAHEGAIDILQRHGQAVHLGLDAVLRRLDPRQKVTQLIRREDVLQTLQRHRMGHRRKLRLAAHPLGRRIGAQEFRVGLLQGLQLAQKHVVVIIRNCRRVQHIILVVIGVELLDQLVDSLFGFHLWFHHLKAPIQNSHKSRAHPPR